MPHIRKASIASAHQVRGWQLTAAIVAAVACTDQPAPPQAEANGRAVFETADGVTEVAEQAASDVIEEAVDFDTFAVDGTGVDGATAGSASQRRWPQVAASSPNAGSVSGHVFDAATGRAIIALGSVSTAAACAGRSCGLGRARGNRGVTTVSLRSGAFAFDAATRQLTLASNTTFRVSAVGYVTAAIAHGPWGAVTNGNQVATELPPIFLCRIGSADRDRDGICDAAENRYGTDPTLVDSDGDALSDAAELYGVWDREVLDIRGLGADPRRADVLLEVDFMPGRKPSDAVVGTVVGAFDRAPPNPNFPNNKPGIALLAWIDDEVDSSADIDWPNYANALPIIQNWFNLRSRWPTHYALFANKLYDTMLKADDPASGISMTVAGTVFFITLHEVELGGEIYVPTDDDKTSTLMHELGHNLGLFHGGDEDFNYKPNYFSVMNYLYQFSGAPLDSGDSDWPLSNRLDYSRFDTPDLTESALLESEGIPPNYPAGSYPISLANPVYCQCLDAKGEDCLQEERISGNIPGSLDFDRDGMISEAPVVADLNGNRTTQDTFRGVRTDWLNLVFDGKEITLPTSRVVASNRPCPGPPLLSTINARFAADGSLEQCPKLPSTTGRFEADGGVEDPEVPDDPTLGNAAPETEVPLGDAGVETDTPEVVSPADAGAWVDDFPQEDGPIEVDAGLGSEGASSSGASDESASEGAAAPDPWPSEVEDAPEAPSPSSEEPMQPESPFIPEDPGDGQDQAVSSPTDGGVGQGY